jgi:hypothetical protein
VLPQYRVLDWHLATTKEHRIVVIGQLPQCCSAANGLTRRAVHVSQLGSLERRGLLSLRETIALFGRLVMMPSIGKDSTVLPLPDGPRQMQFWRFSIQSKRASSSTKALLSEGRASKFKVSRLFVWGEAGQPDAALDSAAITINTLEFEKAPQIARVVRPGPALIPSPPSRARW